MLRRFDNYVIAKPTIEIIQETFCYNFFYKCTRLSKLPKHISNMGRDYGFSTKFDQKN